MKVGIYGGTFDPIHLAHLVVAEYAYAELSLDQLFFVPSYIPPHKLSKTITSPTHRLNMLHLVVDENDKFAISEFELEKGGTSFTVDTLRYMKDQFNMSREDLYLIMGADNLAEFHRWKEPQAIQSLAQIVVAGRPSYDTEQWPSNELLFLHSPLLEISASMIRQRVRDGKSVRYLLPDQVEKYIRDNKLYQQ